MSASLLVVLCIALCSVAACGAFSVFVWSGAKSVKFMSLDEKSNEGSRGLSSRALYWLLVSMLLVRTVELFVFLGIAVVSVGVFMLLLICSVNQTLSLVILIKIILIKRTRCSDCVYLLKFNTY